jgi:glycerol-3-phosphate acyltransferase PlsY
MLAVVMSVGTLVAAYLIGSIPFGYLIARSRGVDIFQQGSGNIGATNVARVLGRRLGILVFVLDFAKGALPVWLALTFAAYTGTNGEESIAPQSLGVCAGLGAFLGHLFPIYLHFRGGKGVATGAGVIVVLVPGPALAALITWVGIISATRYVSLASLAAVVALSLFQLLTKEPFGGPNLIINLFCMLAAVLVFLRHRANITRLVHGNENRIPDGPTMFLFMKTIHVLALGLWFGMVVFFTFVVAPTIFHTFETLGEDVEHRPAWFPEAKGQHLWVDEKINGAKEQGTRAAGYVVGPLFTWYFLLQGVCGFLAVTTGLGWSRRLQAGKVHKVRVSILLAALATVLIGWPLEQKVNQLRDPRNRAVEKFLEAPKDKTAYEAALEAKVDFGRWHLISLFLNFGTVILVGIGMALAAQFPESSPQKPASDLSSATRNQQSGGPDPNPVFTRS